MIKPYVNYTRSQKVVVWQVIIGYAKPILFLYWIHLKDLQDEFNFTYIFISHDLSVVKFMSDRMMVMKAGKIVESGDAEAIYANPQSDYTRQLIEAIPKGI